MHPRTEKNSPAEEGQGNASYSIQREGQKEIPIFCSIICDFSVFVLLSAIIMQYLYDSVWYALKVWVSYKIHDSMIHNASFWRITNLLTILMFLDQRLQW